MKIVKTRSKRSATIDFTHRLELKNLLKNQFKERLLLVILPEIIRLRLRD